MSQASAENCKQALQNQPALRAAGRVVADSFGASVLIMLAATALQRLIGLGRGLLFCRWLDPVQLGYWDMAESFILVSTALTVFSLPAAFGRYLEHFRLSGRFRLIVRQLGAAVVALSFTGAVVIFLLRRRFAQLVFGDASSASLIVILALTLPAIIGYSFFTQLYTGMRLQRIASQLQLFHSTAFALLGCGLIYFWSAAAPSVMLAYFLSCCMVVVFGLIRLVPIYRAEPAAAAERYPLTKFWMKIAPFVLIVWLTDACTNLFSTIDRYMIINFSGFPAHVSLGLVGQYHAAKLLAFLFVQICAVLGTVALPHLSYDWENGEQKRLSARLVLTLKCTVVLLLVGGAALLSVSSPVFNLLFGDKYQLGLAILPVVLCFGFYFGLAFLARTYLWCCERAHVAMFAFLSGLVTNAFLNLLWLPRYGLPGAVWATAVASFVAFVGIVLLSKHYRMAIDRSFTAFCFLPLVITLGWQATAVVLGGVALATLGTNLLFTAAEKAILAEIWRTGLAVSAGFLRRVAQAFAPAVGGS